MWVMARAPVESTPFAAAGGAPLFPDEGERQKHSYPGAADQPRGCGSVVSGLCGCGLGSTRDPRIGVPCDLGVELLCRRGGGTPDYAAYTVGEIARPVLCGAGKGAGSQTIQGTVRPAPGTVTSSPAAAALTPVNAAG